MSICGCNEWLILDTDLASLYQVPTKALNQAVRRNLEKFPEDLLFQLTWEEAAGLPSLMSQFVTLKRGQHLKYRPFAFTEHGALMAATVLNSPRAVAMSLYIIIHSSSPNPISAFPLFVLSSQVSSRLSVVWWSRNLAVPFQLFSSQDFRIFLMQSTPHDAHCLSSNLRFDPSP